jgi:hypothetical protein
VAGIPRRFKIGMATSGSSVYPSPKVIATDLLGNTFRLSRLATNLVQADRMVMAGEQLHLGAECGFGVKNAAQ